MERALATKGSYLAFTEYLPLGPGLGAGLTQVWLHELPSLHSGPRFFDILCVMEVVWAGLWAVALVTVVSCAVQ